MQRRTQLHIRVTGGRVWAHATQDGGYWLIADNDDETVTGVSLTHFELARLIADLSALARAPQDAIRPPTSGLQPRDA